MQHVVRSGKIFEFRIVAFYDADDEEMEDRSLYLNLPGRLQEVIVSEPDGTDEPLLTSQFDRMRMSGVGGTQQRQLGLKHPNSNSGTSALQLVKRKTTVSPDRRNRTLDLNQIFLERGLDIDYM